MNAVGEAKDKAVAAKDEAQSFWKTQRANRPWLDHAVRAYQQLGNTNGSLLAGALTFISFLSLIPLLLLAVSVGAFVLRSHPQTLQDLLDKIQTTGSRPAGHHAQGSGEHRDEERRQPRHRRRGQRGADRSRLGQQPAHGDRAGLGASPAQAQLRQGQTRRPRRAGRAGLGHRPVRGAEFGRFGAHRTHHQAAVVQWRDSCHRSDAGGRRSRLPSSRSCSCSGSC